MKYTTKVKQAQLVGGVRIEPKGGEVSADQAKNIAADPYGRDLIEKKVLTIEGFSLPADGKTGTKPQTSKPADASAQGGAAS